MLFFMAGGGAKLEVMTLIAPRIRSCGIGYKSVDRCYRQWTSSNQTSKDAAASIAGRRDTVRRLRQLGALLLPVWCPCVMMYACGFTSTRHLDECVTVQYYCRLVLLVQVSGAASGSAEGAGLAPYKIKMGMLLFLWNTTLFSAEKFRSKVTKIIPTIRFLAIQNKPIRYSISSEAVLRTPLRELNDVLHAR